MSRTRAVSLLGLCAALVVYVALQLRVGTDITHFMPDRHASELAALSMRLTDSPFTRTMVLSVGAEQPEVAVQVAQALAAELRAHPEVAWLRAGVDEAQLQELYQLYFPRRHGFLSERPEEELPRLFEEAALRERARAVRLRLASPGASLFEASAASDPLGGFERVIQRFRGGESQLTSRGGQFMSPDGRYAILLLGLRSSAFASGPQARLLRDLDAAFARVSAGRAELEMSGANRFGVSIERSMKRDIYRIAALSFFGVALLFFLFVGSLRGFLVVSLPPLAGILVATAGGIALFGSLDGLTMAFGASLMGIGIDYSNHLLIHHGLGPPGTAPATTARRLRASLGLGAATTVASLGGMAVTAFPAFREMSCFAAVGVLVALAVSLAVVPDLLRFVPPLPARAVRCAAGFARLQRRLEVLSRPLLWLPLAAALAGLAWLPQLDWQDDMSQLADVDQALRAEDQRVRERVGAPESGYFVVGLAKDAGAAVALNDRIQAALAGPLAGGDVAGVRSLHALLWSEQLQRRNLKLVYGQADLAERVEHAFVAEGFRVGALAPFARALSEPAPAPLTLADLEASPLAELIEPYVFRMGERTAVVTTLRGVGSADAVREALAGIPGVHVLDQRSFVSDVYGEFRQTTLRQLGVGALLVLALLALRYRAWRPTLAAFLPSVVVVLLVLEGLALTGVRTNLMHVLSLVMVTGMGVDYGVFLVDSAHDRRDLGATLLSLLMSCLTTALVFGTLTLSSQPALRAIGVTTGVGILLSYALAPLALVALGVRSRAA